MTVHTPESLHCYLKSILKSDVELLFNENRSTLLNILEKRWGYIRLSIHKMFLNAPEAVLIALVHFIRNSRHDRSQWQRTLRHYINHNQERTPHQRVYKKELAHQGDVYNLREVYSQVNQDYFHNQLDLPITWYGPAKKRGKGAVTFGLYIADLHLIKINRILDHPFFPDYFVTFVVYHEMLHHIIPPTISSTGRRYYHHPFFKRREREFADYERAMTWEKNNCKWYELV